jgi:hypothetical protein
MNGALALAGLLAAVVAASITRARPAEITPAPAASAEPTLPPCVHAGPPVNIPSEFPKNFPFPPGTLITGNKPAKVGTALIGFIPMQLDDARRFFIQKLPAAGFQLGRGEVEPGEIEARFAGNAVVGYFKIRSVPDCPGALEFTIGVRPMPSTPSPTPPPK